MSVQSILKRKAKEATQKEVVKDTTPESQEEKKKTERSSSGSYKEQGKDEKEE